MYLKHACLIICTTFSLFGMEPATSYETLQLLVGKQLFLYMLENRINQSSTSYDHLFSSLSTTIDHPIFKEAHKHFFENCCPFETYKEFLLTEIITYGNRFCPESIVLRIGSLMFPKPDPHGSHYNDHINYILQNAKCFPKGDLHKLKPQNIKAPTNSIFDHTIRDRIITEQKKSYNINYQYKSIEDIAIAFVNQAYDLIASAHDAHHAHERITQFVHEYLRESELDQPTIVSENLEQYITFTNRMLTRIHLSPHQKPNNYTMKTIVKVAFPDPHDDFLLLFQQEIESTAPKSSRKLLGID